MIPDGKSRKFSDRLSAAFNRIRGKIRKDGPNTAPVYIAVGESAREPFVVLKMPRPLDIAVRNDDKDEVKRLLAAGADPNLNTHFSGPALNEAVEHSDVGMMRLLVDNGADVNAVNKAGSTPLHRAVTAWKDKDAKIEFLLECGADATLRDFNGDTPAVFARHCGCEDAAALIESKARKTAPSPKTPKPGR